MTYNGTETMQEGDLIYSYSGMVTPDFTRELLRNLENLLHVKSASPRFKRNVFTVVNESLHNIEKYALQERKPGLLPIIAIKNAVNGYIFTVENALPIENFVSFKQKLDEITGLDIAELRNSYLKQLFTESAAESHNAGLGLLAIAIRSGKNLEYSFTEINEKIVRVKLVIITER